MNNLPYWLKVLFFSIMISILGNIIFFVISSFNYGMCYHDIEDYACNSSKLFFQGIIVSILIIEPLIGLSYIIPFIILFLIGYYLLPLIKKKK